LLGQRWSRHRAPVAVLVFIDCLRGREDKSQRDIRTPALEVPRFAAVLDEWPRRPEDMTVHLFLERVDLGMGQVRRERHALREVSPYVGPDPCRPSQAGRRHAYDEVGWWSRSQSPRRIRGAPSRSSTRHPFAVAAMEWKCRVRMGRARVGPRAERQTSYECDSHGPGLAQVPASPQQHLLNVSFWLAERKTRRPQKCGDEAYIG
jgi:hypothetical protein